MALYAATIFLSAFLLFQVQPIIAKLVLPWFGGSAAVWTTCMLFFQVMLVAGYLYSHWFAGGGNSRWRPYLHCALAALSLASLPIIPRETWKPSGTGDPTTGILLLLLATVGLPYFLLSTTGPLLQTWYSRRHPEGLPYRLFALSNAASLLALISYPVAIEPLLPNRMQAWVWSIGYVGFAALVSWCALTHLPKTAPATSVPPAAAPASTLAQIRKPGWGLVALWIALPACASALLLAITNHLSQNVAAIPFLWVLPLSLYLLTFMICFEKEHWYTRTWNMRALAVALGGLAYGLHGDNENTAIKVLIPVFSMALFIACMSCHGELAKLKPPPRYLTLFYLMVSIGGAIGGLFVGVFAPLVFTTNLEFPIAIAACGILMLVVMWRDPASVFYQATWQPEWLTVCAMVIALCVSLAVEFRDYMEGARLLVRNFYGSLRVMDTGDEGDIERVRRLTHGTINHGEQILSEAKRRQPTTYYGFQSGVGLAIENVAPPGLRRIGVIGLGAGVIASYAMPGDVVRYYEINPLVERLARTEFTYIPDAKDNVTVVLGDARLSLEREEPQRFDVLAVDAFSSDSIPVHLLTREAFALYFRHLRKDGILAVHISNRYLDLAPVVGRAAQDAKKAVWLIESEDDDKNEIFGATWVLLSGRADWFTRDPLKAAGEAVKLRPTLRPWTDDFSNLFQILK